MHKDPTECYQQLFSKGIGTMVADLYISWAYCYDLCGNYRKAEEIFRHGIACRAEPVEELQEAHQHFGFIVSQRFIYKHDANETELANQQLNERRLALTSLQSHRKKIGSIRTGSAVKSFAPGTIQVCLLKTFKEFRTKLQDINFITLLDRCRYYVQSALQRTGSCFLR